MIIVIKKIVCDTYDELCLTAADVFTEQLKKKPDSVLGLATGETALGLYDELISRYNAGKVDFSKAQSFNLDEYYPIDPEHRQSYVYYMKENFFDKVNLAKYQLPDGMATDPDAEGIRFDEEIDKAGGIDLIVLGIGHNGHIGFNEPAPSYYFGTHLEDLAESSITANSRFFEADEVQPTKALTMGMGTIFKAKKIIQLVSGAGKAEIVKRVSDGMIHTDIPTSLLHLHPDMTMIVDKKANGE